MYIPKHISNFGSGKYMYDVQLEWPRMKAHHPLHNSSLLNFLTIKKRKFISNISIAYIDQQFRNAASVVEIDGFLLQ